MKLSPRIGAQLLRVVFVILAASGGLLAQSPTITTASLPNGTATVAYPAQTLAATGGTTPYTWSITVGALPTGLTLDAVTGVIDGTPTTAGTFNFTVTVTDSASPTPQTAIKPFTVVIAVFITATSLPDGRVGTAYPPTTLAATGGGATYTWLIVSGALPSGLTMSTAGTISGTPTFSGFYTFTVRATGSATGAPTGTRTLTIAVPPTITTTSIPNGSIGAVYSPVSLTASASSTTLVWSVTAGTLPPGLTLSSAGVISGTPTATGTFNVTIGVTDGSTPPLSTTKDFSITIQAGLTITTASPLPFGAVGVFYTQPIATAGPTPTGWSIVSGVLPPSITLNTAGSLIGTPTVAGNFNFTIQVQGGNPVQTATKAFQLSINSSLGIITLATLPSATVNVSYSTTLSAAGGTPPYTWNNIGLPLPAGLTLSSAGVLSGTPTAVGNFSLTIQVVDSFSPPQQASRAFTLSIGINPVITTSTLATGAVGITYGPQTLTATGGVQPYIWSVVAGTLPTGLNLSSDGILSGTPVVAGTFNVTLGINDSSANTLTATKAFTMTIHPAISITTTSPLPLGVAGALYNRRVEATGPPAITWSVFSGVLPPGISLAPGGTLGGIPNLAGTFDFILQADSTNPAQNARQSLQIVINPALSISTLVALPDAPVGSAYSTQLVAVGGVAPYNWVTQGGIIPPGLTLSNTGLLSGTPLGVGSFTFTTQVSDSFTPTQQTSRTFNIVVGNPLTITTASLPNAFQNLAYSQQIVATGTAPLTWSVTSGTLPTGLTLASNGTVQGTPTGLGSSSFTATVIDGRGATNARNFTIVVDPAIGTFSVPGLPANIRPTQPSDVEVTLSAPHPSTLTGKLVLTFTSKAEVAGDDPNLKFSTNSRTVDFTVPANTTSAVFPSRIMLLPGTVAGTVTLTANIDNGPSLPVATVEVSALAPQITNVAGVRTLQGLEVQITGYASSRRVTNVEFSFEVKSGNSTITVPLTRNVDSDFAAWYRSSSSIPFGSAFSFVQSFTVTQGDLSAIQAVIVRLTNAQGSTTTARIPLQ